MSVRTCTANSRPSGIGATMSMTVKKVCEASAPP
jgi:hypothetical protein